MENETKGKADLLRLKKKLESDINELEIALDHANQANADAQKNLRKYQDQIRELQQQVNQRNLKFSLFDSLVAHAVQLNILI